VDEQMKAVIQEIMAAGGYVHPLGQGLRDEVASAAVDRWAARGMIEQGEVEGWYYEALGFLTLCDREAAVSA
jgi:hypothetical protein